MAKKDFSNPAMSFISQESIDKVDGKKKKTGTAKKSSKEDLESYRINPEYIETKSKRVQLLVQPSLHEEVVEISRRLGISANDFIHRAIKEAVYNDYVRELIEKDIKEKR